MPDKIKNVKILKKKDAIDVQCPKCEAWLRVTKHFLESFLKDLES